jgi:hypothetical protein
MSKQPALLCKPCDGTGFTEDDGVCLSCMKTGCADWMRHWSTPAREIAGE